MRRGMEFYQRNAVRLKLFGFGYALGVSPDLQAKDKGGSGDLLVKRC